MKLAEDIRLSFGSLYIPHHTILTDRHILRLIRMGIEQVSVLEPWDIHALNKKQMRIRKALIKTQEQFTGIYHRIQKGERISYGEIEDVVDGIVDKILDDENILCNMMALKERDSYTYRHMINVSILSALMAKWLNLPAEQVRNAAAAGLLHDIGKSLIPLDILNKPGRLTPDEFDHMKRHPLLGYDISRKLKGITAETLCAIASHHERDNSSGYPFGLPKDRIPLLGKVSAIVDVYDAMTSDRCYRQKNSPFKVLNVLQEESKERLDSGLVHVFIENISGYLVGSPVDLSNQEQGYVLSIPADQPHRPLVVTDTGIYDLSVELHLHIDP
jgi:putative nucleotidyltransferase with HDIG domain